MGHLHRSRCVPLATTSFSPLFCVISGVWSVLFFFVASKVTCQKMKTVWMMPWLCAVLRIILKVAISVFHNHGFSLSAVTQFASISALLLIFFFHRTPHHPTPIRASDVFGQDGEQRKWLSSALFFSLSATSCNEGGNRTQRISSTPMQQAVYYYLRCLLQEEPHITSATGRGVCVCAWCVHTTTSPKHNIRMCAVM